MTFKRYGRASNRARDEARLIIYPAEEMRTLFYIRHKNGLTCLRHPAGNTLPNFQTKSNQSFGVRALRQLKNKFFSFRTDQSNRSRFKIQNFQRLRQ